MPRDAGSADANTYAELRAAVLSLRLMPGERLSERGLEQELGASRTPIRAALLRLENEGLTSRTGRGWRVTPIDLTEVRAVMEYREAIEVAAVSLAIERATDEEVAAVRDLASSPRPVDDEESVLRDGSDFHLAIARLSRNPFFVDAVSGALTRLSRTRWLEVRDAASRAQARDQHLAIIDAIASRDLRAATDQVVAHCRGTRDRLLAALGESRQGFRARGLAIVESATEPPSLMAI